MRLAPPPSPPPLSLARISSGTSGRHTRPPGVVGCLLDELERGSFLLSITHATSGSHVVCIYARGRWAAAVFM